ncbi:MAG: hypothetical protein EBS01_02175 [Verrucomicrobia bacterium]|nr:hypothetical protein [Verrucomicrobiota bacterium]
MLVSSSFSENRSSPESQLDTWPSLRAVTSIIDSLPLEGLNFHPDRFSWLRHSMVKHVLPEGEESTKTGPKVLKADSAPRAAPSVLPR